MYMVESGVTIYRQLLYYAVNTTALHAAAPAAEYTVDPSDANIVLFFPSSSSLGVLIVFIIGNVDAPRSHTCACTHLDVRVLNNAHPRKNAFCLNSKIVSLASLARSKTYGVEYSLLHFMSLSWTSSSQRL